MNARATFTAPKTALRPGERMVRGAIDVFDMGLRNDALAAEAMEACPADLSGLSDDALRGLRCKWLVLDRRYGERADVVAFADKVFAEFTRRGWDGTGAAPAQRVA